MESVFAELPLAVFTTLAPLGAGAFVALACALCLQTYAADEVANLGKKSFVPLAVAVVGFIAAMFHLANPFHALNVFAGVGTSPLSNEVIAGMVFVVVALACCAFVAAGKATAPTARGAYVVAGIIAVVFAAFTGMAYLIPTIPSWNSVLVPLSLVCFAIGGGFVFLTALLGGSNSPHLSKAFKTTVKLAGPIGLALGAIVACAHIASVSGMSNSLVAGSTLVQGALPFAVAGIALIAVGAALSLVSARTGKRLFAWIAVALVALGILCFRLAFYALRLSVGLAL